MNELIFSPVFLQILFSLVAIFVTYLITFIVIKIINRTIKDIKRKYTGYASPFFVPLLGLLFTSISVE